jgi:hypothetical protein
MGSVERFLDHAYRRVGACRGVQDLLCMGTLAISTKDRILSHAGLLCSVCTMRVGEQKQQEGHGICRSARQQDFA